MDRVRVLTQQITLSGKGPAEPQASDPPAECPMKKVPQKSRRHEVEEMVQRIHSTKDPREQRKLLFDEIGKSGDQLMKDGTWPVLTMMETGTMVGHEADVPVAEEIARLLQEVPLGEAFSAIDMLPGPWQDAHTVEQRVELIRHTVKEEATGHQMFQYMRWMQQYGDRGLASNIVVPVSTINGTGSKMNRHIGARVIVGDPSDAERLSRVHTKKEGNFCPVLYDSLIATDDNEHWQKQRRHLTEAFLPLSTLAEILPKSLSRAKNCAERLRQMSQEGRTEVDMSDFLLHEAQAQLQLALLGCPEAFMESTNKGIRATFMGEQDESNVGVLTGAMQDIMAMTEEATDFALPSDRRPVKAPLSRAVGTGDLPGSANFGNMLLILFAGHDTTGHTMTWLLFELARHPEVQKELQHEVDGFFREQEGRDPTYRDLARLPFMNRCITETLRLWPAVPNGTFRRLQFAETVKGPGGKEVLLPRGTPVQIANWPRHRNPELWGADVHQFNPHRKFEPSEVAAVGCPMAAANPQSYRFSPFAHAPRNCLGRNFAQMEMRLIMLYILRNFEFKLAPPYDKLMGADSSATPETLEFRGINRGGTMGPMNLEGATDYEWGTRHTVAMKMFAQPRA